MRPSPPAVPQADGIVPNLGIYLRNKQLQPMPWNTRWGPLPDFRLPADREDAVINTTA